ncbi:hypothetical protein VTJ49DRAFT_5878 [Mycothermus thermophilus]|uniref:Uncharacterized protein n=1 Tax=Humicola insolens TaxID=85995 RepID=A0ABR3VMT1_HUMIN
METDAQPSSVPPSIVVAASSSSTPSMPAAAAPEPRGGPTPSPLPCPAPASGPEDATSAGPADNNRTSSSSSSSSSDSESEHEPKPTIRHPKLLLKIQDLAHPGTAKFFRAVPDPGAVLAEAVDNIDRHLYCSPDGSQKPKKKFHAPPTRSVTLVLRDMDGVAYTTGSEIDNDHKEIHFSLRYIDHIRPESRLAAEIRGVLTHELVHCYQWDARRTCPGGLIEGVADWVRLCCDLGPPHWRRGTEGSWDKGYDHTAYFLQYLETRFGPGTVQAVNAKLRRHEYRGDAFWRELLGMPVEELYADYVKAVKGGEGDGKGIRIQNIGNDVLCTMCPSFCSSPFP